MSLADCLCVLGERGKGVLQASIYRFCVLTPIQINLFNAFPLYPTLTMQISSKCGVCACKSAHLLRDLLKVSFQCWVVTHMSFSGLLLLLCSLWRIIYMSSCLVALLKLLLSGQMCLPGYSINFCFCKLEPTLEWTHSQSNDWCSCPGCILYQEELFFWANNHKHRSGWLFSGCFFQSCLKAS